MRKAILIIISIERKLTNTFVDLIYSYARRKSNFLPEVITGMFWQELYQKAKIDSL